MEINITSDALKEFLTSGLSELGIGFVILIVVLLLIYHWDRVEKFFLSIHNFLLFSKKKQNLGRIRTSLQSDINKSILEITNEAPNCFSEAVKVDWLQEGSELANVSKKAIYIKLNENQDTDLLFIRALALLFEKAFLIDSRNYLHHHVFEGMTLVLQKRIIANSHFRSAATLFYKTIYDPKVLDKSVAQVVGDLKYLDTQGLFTRVFLNECTNLSNAFGIELLGAQPKWDIYHFLGFTVNLLKTLENKEQRIEFEYKSKTFNLAYAVLADSSVGHRMGISFYVNRTKKSILQGASIIYIIAIGRTNTQLSYRLANHLSHQNYIGDKKTSNYFITNDKGEKIPAITIRCATASNAVEKIADDESMNDLDVIIDDPLLSEILNSKITDPEIQFVKSAWVKGYQAQVVVNSSNNRKNPVQTCIGQDGNIGREINSMAGDFVRFVRWSPDIREAIRNNLDNHDRDSILDIQLDPSSRTEIIYVSSRSDIEKLCGPRRTTLLLAEAITDFHIKIKVDPKILVQEAINKIIPEVNSGQIRVVSIVIIPNNEIRILVHSRVTATPEKICASYIDALIAELKCEEPIYFCNRCDLIIDTLYGSLYPLRRSEIVRIEQGEDNNFFVYVKDRFARNKAIGKDGIHIKAVNKLLGVRIQIIVNDSK